MLFCWGFTSDVPRGNLQAGQKKIEEALSNLAPLGESFWRSMCTLSLLLLDYYGAENGQAGLRSHEFIELWKKIRFAATPLSCIFRHSLESGNREQAEQILAHVEAADLNLQTLGYDTLDSVLGCLGIAEYSDYIGKPEQAEKFAKRTFTLNLKRSHRVTFALFPPILYARILIKQNRKLQALGILGIAWINQLLRVRVFHPQTCYESGRWFFALGWPRVGRMIIERGIRYASARNWLTPAAEGRLLLGELMHEFDPDLAHVYVHMARQHFQVRNWKFHENLCEQVLNNRKSTRNEETEGSLVTEQASRSATRRSTALRQQVETRALMDILLKLSATNDTTALYQGLLESLCQATGAELAVLYFRENERWFPHAAHNIRIEAADLFKVKVDQHFIQKTLQASPTDPIIRKSEGQQWGRPSAAGSVMLLPLKSEGTIAGYCYLANTQLYDLFSQRSIDIAQPIATQGAIALQNIRLNKQLAVERDQISRLHQTLELRVIEQTRDIQSIMEHIELGICTVSGSDISIHKDYSRHLEYVFAESNLRDKPLMPLLAHCTTMTADEIDQASQALLACFNEQEFAFEANSHLLPRSLNGLNQNHDRFAFELDWIPICNDYHTVERVLVSIKDVTALKGMEKAAAQKDEEMGIISEILNRSEHDWSNFTRNCNSLASKNRILMEDLQTCSDPMSTLKSMFMNIHTVKGIARSFGFRQMNDAIHSAEQFFVDVMSKNPLNVNLDAVQLNLSTIEATFQRYHNIAIQKLARKVSGDEAVNVPRNPLMTIYEHLNIQLESGTPFSDCLLDSIKVMRQSLFISLEGLVRQLFSETAPISVELGKPVPDLSLNIVELWVGRSTEDLLRNCFVHLLRNSLDHGIQMPAERQAKGLPAHGTVRVTARLRGRMVDLFVEDDGRGLDLKKLQEIGLKKGLLARQASENAENLANLIFNADLSTAETVTSISGRGVGMAAVKESIDQVGGIINIRLQKNRAVDEGYCAFAFVISLPLVLFQLDDSQKAA
ncbi:MAG TPA: ATP-binding protein [Oligoflexus sp.]|uniref:ATP-binding protein n=1 Tax=Oligoflexus sp. TaxID=1971216 RepID=UPI002D65E9FD|nr:ATP-binding protein [Oligoflexus sp.]HYX34142.1 ATP-binding protein [Oligoflexus sp.]